MRPALLFPLLLLVSCGAEPARDEAASAPVSRDGSNNAAPSPDPAGDSRTNEASPPAPSQPGGLPQDRNSVLEAPFAETSAQGAANVVQTYFALLEQGRYDEAWRLWSAEGEASGMTRQAFAASFARYRDYHAQIGAPGRIEGAAGSLYVEVPVQVHGRLEDGTPVNMVGSVTLRRVNEVPGSTAEQRRWHIARSDLKPRPQG